MRKQNEHQGLEPVVGMPDLVSQRAHNDEHPLVDAPILSAGHEKIRNTDAVPVSLTAFMPDAPQPKGSIMIKRSLALIACAIAFPAAQAGNIIRLPAPIIGKTYIAPKWSPAAPLATELSSIKKCEEWSPEPITILVGRSFEQLRPCTIRTTSQIQPREIEASSGMYRNAGEPYELTNEHKATESQQAVGALHLFETAYKASSLNDWVTGVYRRIDTQTQTGTRIEDTSEYSVLFYFYRNSKRTSCQVRYAHVLGLGFDPSVTATEFSKTFMANHRHATLYKSDGSVFRDYRFEPAWADDGSWYVSQNIPCEDVNAVYVSPGSFTRLRLAND